MRSVNAPIGAKAADMFEPCTLAAAKALRGAGFEVLARYTDNITAEELAMLLGEGFLVFFVTTSPAPGYMPLPVLGATKHQAASKKLQELGVPTTVTAFVDLEGMGGDADMHIVYANASCAALAPYVPGVYVGDAVGLTGDELYHQLNAKRYWKSCSKVIDRFGHTAEPSCGWCVVQGYPPNAVINGVTVDVDFCYADYSGRTVTCVAA